jgi:hypothetical protein
VRFFSPFNDKSGLENADVADRDTIAGMFDRLHKAKFVQGSAYERNVLVQPGPLTQPRAERSLDNPSYRLIDFGRGECYVGDESDTADRDENIKYELRRLRSRILYGSRYN